MVRATYKRKPFGQRDHCARQLGSLGGISNAKQNHPIAHARNKNRKASKAAKTKAKNGVGSARGKHTKFDSSPARRGARGKHTKFDSPPSSPARRVTRSSKKN